MGHDPCPLEPCDRPLYGRRIRAPVERENRHAVEGVDSRDPPAAPIRSTGPETQAPLLPARALPLAEPIPGTDRSESLDAHQI